MTSLLLYLAPLIFYPLARLLRSRNARRLRWLRIAFWAYVTIQILAWAFVQYCMRTSPDWLHSLIVPHLAALLGLVANVVVLTLTERHTPGGAGP